MCIFLLSRLWSFFCWCLMLLALFCLCAYACFRLAFSAFFCAFSILLLLLSLALFLIVLLPLLFLLLLWGLVPFVIARVSVF